MGANSFYNLIRYKQFACLGLIVSKLNLEISSIKQHLLSNCEVPHFCSRKHASFVLDLFEDLVDMVVHCSHSKKTFFCCSGEEFVVVVEVHGVCIKAKETSVCRVCVGSGGCSVIGTCGER